MLKSLRGYKFWVFGFYGKSVLDTLVIMENNVQTEYRNVEIQMKVYSKYIHHYVDVTIQVIYLI